MTRRSSRLTIYAAMLACLLPAGRSALLADEKPARISDGLVVLYTFENRVGNMIQDHSGVTPRLDLKIEKPQAVSRRGGKFLVTSSARIVSTEPAKKVVDAIRKSGELTLEVWVKPTDDRQSGPARILSLSLDTGQRNFTLGQDGNHYDVRLRSSATNTNGIPSLAAPAGSVQTELSHVVYSRDRAGVTKIYVNAREHAAGKTDGDLAGWSDSYHLLVANEETGDRPWLGELHLAAIYGRALSAEEIGRNHAAGVRPAEDYAARLPPATTRPVDFVNEVQPLLRKRCFECHAAGNEEGGLNLGIRERAFEGGDHGAVLVRGDSAGSRLIHLVARLEKDAAMPPEGPALTADEIGLLRAWVDQGMQWPDGADVLDPRTERARNHWAFQPLQKVELPALVRGSRARTPIDRFVLAKLESAGLAPAPPADSRSLIRRVYFDLIGLPPTPEEIREFGAAAARDASKAVETLVDRLLQSPHYGERWGRHWLDLARYADSDGQESDADRPNAYHYRDFVIRALNDDMPFDQFVRWQLAGDEYEPQNPSAVAATGFLAAGTHAALGDNLMEDERLRTRYNELDDVVATIGTGILGLTLGCARCHDHKYDAIPARDYYRMMSAFHSGDRAEVQLGSTAEKALAWRDFGPEPKPSWLFHRGDYYDQNQPVSLGFVGILTRGKTSEDFWTAARADRVLKESTSQRRALADWMTDVTSGAGSLVARVIVNRVWQHHFGRALVQTVGDFGVRSELPAHPELLEWLAHDFVQQGWRLKRLHRLILTSAVDQQASTSSAAPASDPENRLLWKMRVQRIDAEVLRDSMLAVSGTLNRTVLGPSFKPPIAAEAMLARNLKDAYPAKIDDTPAVRRRSIYMFHKRVVPYPLMQAFDKPDAQQGCGRRDTTTVAPQALALLNDPFVRTVSLDFADRLIKDSGSEPAQWIERGFQLARGRGPRESERTAALAFLEVQIRERQNRDKSASADEARRRALSDLCQTLFSLNEFIYID